MSESQPRDIPANSPTRATAPRAEQDLPRVRALDELWQSLQQGRYSLSRLWQRARLGRYVSLRFISPQDFSLKMPMAMVNDCASCLNNCCIGPHATVSLRIRDIATLLDIGRSELISHQKPQFSQRERQQRPALDDNVSSLAWRVFPVLAKNSFAACEALTDTGRCSIYPNWPLVCARFPYALADNHKAISFSTRCAAPIAIHPHDKRIEQLKYAVAQAYNERIKDWLLLLHAGEQLRSLGVLDHVAMAEGELLKKFALFYRS